MIQISGGSVTNPGSRLNRGESTVEKHAESNDERLQFSTYAMDDAQEAEK